MTEGLADLIARREARIPPFPLHFRYYVAAYEALAETLNADVESLWREVWKAPPGSIRTHFERLLHLATHPTMFDRRRLRTIADLVFATERSVHEPDEDELRRLWQQIRV